VKVSLKPTWNKWWQTKTGKLSKPKSFHPALSAHVEELLGHIDNIVFKQKNEKKLEHIDLVMGELIPEVRNLRYHFGLNIYYIVYILIKKCNLLLFRSAL